MSENKTKDWAAVAARAEEPESSQQTENVSTIEHPEYAELQNKLTEAEQLAQQRLNDFLHAQADVQNIQRRAERDVANAHKYSIEKMASELLPVIDCLERSLTVDIGAHIENAEARELLKNMHIGIELTLKMFLESLDKFGIKQINPLGEIFNPDQHTAMTVQEDPNVKPNTVLQVMQKGYLLKDRLLRPALVIVAKNK